MHKQTLEPKENTDMLLEVIGIAKREERKGRALAVSIRLEALATHITNKGLSAIEAAETVAPRSHPL